MKQICLITPFFKEKNNTRRACSYNIPFKFSRYISHAKIITTQEKSEIINDSATIGIKRHTLHKKLIYSPGQHRNEIISKVNYNNIFILDSDLIPSDEILLSIIDKTYHHRTSSPQCFDMYPCLYLTKEETERFDGDFQGCLESFLRGENHRVEGVALASSCLLMNREWFLQLGGFDEQFVGHGGEDLELIDRLTRHYPIGPRPDDYALNIKAQHPGDYQGFRRYFSYYALPHLFAGRFLVHQWHPRPLTHPYHKRRAGNDQLLEQMLARSEAERGPLKGPVVPCNDLGGELPDFREWMIRLQEEAGYPVQEYPGLLRWQDGIKPKRPLWRKLRKLYLNPRAFFRDMFNPRSR
ncbi:galactosyltransferase-related protein [Aeromonas dhakensis]|uniref:galactosyltransferase-related protein n=2 Tax=Aeromonas dhakensis TaxID=196024 RepID=UPI003BA2873A